MGYALAGLLSGVGQGMVMAGKSIEERRQQALAQAAVDAREARDAARRAAERKEDRGWKESDDKTQREHELTKTITAGRVQLGLQDDAQAHSSVEASKERDFKAAREDKQMGHDANMARLRASLETKRDEASVRLRAEIDSGQVLDTYTTEDGKLAIVYKGGRREITDDPGSRSPAAMSAFDPTQPAMTGAVPPAQPVDGRQTFNEALAHVQAKYPKMPKKEQIALAQRMAQMAVTGGQ